MAIIQALLAMVLRSAGRLLNTAFGWATVMLFGKRPQDRQICLSAVAFGSVIWLATARQRASWTLRLPTKILAVFARRPLADVRGSRGDRAGRARAGP